MILNVATPIHTPQLASMLESVGASHLLQGTVYSPLMQLLIAPSQQGEDALMLWELTQKLYANKDGKVELVPAELNALREKCALIAFPWLRARVMQILNEAV